MTAYHRSQEAKARISAAVTAWWRKRREATERWQRIREQRIRELQDAGRTQKAIGRELGVTQQRVCQILKAIARRGRP